MSDKVTIKVKRSDGFEIDFYPLSVEGGILVLDEEEADRLAGFLEYYANGGEGLFEG